ncbi:bacteriocin-type signal sequence-containing protein [Aquimarina amphilecti]|uniref:Bacteriocin-type signal sequence-containing protein n=1 Tax=Aquimarina amphilecti TaxID=1038014 RepID=A0A1H7KQD1_AQUAM|nr:MULTISPECIES: bacteriocin [Aquimarina]MBQ4801734.1 bacteriocin [Aquimarina sp. MMG015]SEK89073.1 bacteriocin-type signal sequence-containing protein [Aquimarina amphilecti]
MKNLENFGVQELNNFELNSIEGGNWFGDAWDATVEAVSDAADAVVDAVSSFADGVADGWNAAFED